MESRFSNVTYIYIFFFCICNFVRAIVCNMYPDEFLPWLNKVLESSRILNLEE